MKEQLSAECEARIRTPQEVLNAIYNALVKIGWLYTSGVLADRCTKEFQTAVGFKTATAVAGIRRDGAVTVRGEYDSEARNVLERLNVCILRNASDDLINSLVYEFAEGVDELVSDTYAVRLLHNLQERDQG